MKEVLLYLEKSPWNVVWPTFIFRSALHIHLVSKCLFIVLAKTILMIGNRSIKDGEYAHSQKFL